MASCMMHERTGRLCVQSLGVGRRKGSGGCTFIPKTLRLGGHGRKMSCLIMQSVCWEIGRRRGKERLVNMNKSNLGRQYSRLVKDGPWGEKAGDQILPQQFTGWVT